MNQPKKAVYLKLRQKETTEPRDFSVPDRLRGCFCVQEHHAKRAGFHHDLRIEKDGVAISWAIPKGLPKRGEPGRLAIHTEDHPVRYMEWSGSIPTGSYGAGEVRLVELGRYDLLEFVRDGDELTKVKVRLHAEKHPEMSGVYSLMRQQERGWLAVHKSSED